MLDEPTSALDDEAVQAQGVDLLRDLQKRYSLAYSLHQPRSGRSFARSHNEVKWSCATARWSNTGRRARIFGGSRRPTITKALDRPPAFDLATAPSGVVSENSISTTGGEA